MLDILRLFASAVIAYLIGSLNFGIIFTKLFTGKDLRTLGSGNAGSTNAYRVLGPKALLVVLGDAIKGVVAVLIGKLIFGDDGQLCAYLFVLFGHAYPVFYGFHGGKGILTTAAAMLTIDWRVTAVLFTLFLIIVLITRYVSLGSMIAVSLIPLTAYLFGSGDIEMITALMFMSMWLVMLHRDNISRLLAGTESKFSFKTRISQ